jgi:hypothetical protein
MERAGIDSEGMLTSPAYPVRFVPDLDTAWSVNPGALTEATAFAPLQQGYLGSISHGNALSNLNTLTGADIVAAYTFRQVDGTVRLLMFRNGGDIDEYITAGTRTNRATGLTASLDWQAITWGNQVIAVSPENATQSSTGAGFSALSGAPKARHIAANLNFVMLADVDDGGSYNYGDAVWWCALRNPASWTPSVATLCGRIQLLDSPGPITALIAFGDSFVAFKDNALFIAQFVGAQNDIFSWRMVSNIVGCVDPKAVAELDGVLYFYHTSGFWSFDGQTLRNIGVPVFQSFLAERGTITRASGTGIDNTAGSALVWGRIEAIADTLEGVLWFACFGKANISGSTGFMMYGYNPRSGLWGHRSAKVDITANATQKPTFLRTNWADLNAFTSDPQGRAWVVFNAASGNTTLRSIRYPDALTTANEYISCGAMGSYDLSAMNIRIYPRLIRGSSSAAVSTGTAAGYTTEDRNVTNGTVNMIYNTEFGCLDARLSARFRNYTVVFGSAKVAIVGGLAVDDKPGGAR